MLLSRVVKFAVALIAVTVGTAVTATSTPSSSEALTAPAGRCHALAISGGGSWGSYEVGVLQALVANLPKEETNWRVVSGISAGSMQAAIMGTYPVGQEKAALETCSTIIRNLKKEDVFVDWSWGGVLKGLISEASIFDSRPLRETMKKALSVSGYNQTDRLVTLGATNLNTGLQYLFNETELLDGVVASSAIPAVFTPLVRDGVTYVDGGAKYQINVFSAIDRCQELGYALNDIVIDMVMVSGNTLAQAGAETTTYHTLKVLERYLQINTYDKLMKQIDEVKDAFPTVTFRYEVFPSTPIKFSSLDFDPKHADALITLGEMDGANAIKQYAQKTGKPY